MSWQDYIIAVGNLIFAISLLPSILSQTDKPHLKTSLPTALVLFVFVVTLSTLRLWFSAVATAIAASLWLTLAVQTILAKQRIK
jgi:hypothetical protein